MKNLYLYIEESLKRLGKGEEGIVYDLGDGKVKKVFHRGKVPMVYQLMKSATDYGVIECLPKVFEVGDDYIIRENCKPGTKKCKEYYKLSQCNPWVNTESCMNLVLNGHYWYDPDNNSYYTDIKGIVSKPLMEVINWMVRLKYEISQVTGQEIGLGDFALKNLGETSDGRVVLMDI